MITEIINYQILGNDLWRVFLFLLTIALIPSIRTIVNEIVEIIVVKITSKTESKVDDALIEALESNMKFILLTIAFFVGKLYLNITGNGIIGKIYLFIDNLLLTVTIVLFLIKFLNNLTKYYLNNNKKTKINKTSMELILQIVDFTLYTIGVIVILDSIEGIEVTALLAGLGVGGLAFAFAAQDMIKNFFSGVMIIFDKTFNIGDKINFNGNSGIIENLKLRSTKLRTYDGTLLTIPNSMLTESVVENVTKTPKVKIKQVFNVTYDTNSKKIKKAKEIIKDAILSEDLAENDGITIWFDNFGATSLDIQVIYYSTLDMNAWPERVYVKERVNFKILEGFEKAGIEFAFPTQTVHVKK